MSKQSYFCESGVGSLQIEVYKDGSGFNFTCLDDTGEVEARILFAKRATAKDIINQLQEYLDETSESTPA